MIFRDAFVLCLFLHCSPPAGPIENFIQSQVKMRQTNLVTKIENRKDRANIDFSKNLVAQVKYIYKPVLFYKCLLL